MHVQRIVHQLVKKHKTTNPYELSGSMNILLRREPLGTVKGYYTQIYRTKCIVLNSELERKSPEEHYVLAHELGHSVMHPCANTPFLSANTYLSVEKMEIQANRFAMLLLISDDELYKYCFEKGYTLSMLAQLWGYKKELIELRLRDMP